jgi:hypothetical protein
MLLRRITLCALLASAAAMACAAAKPAAQKPRTGAVKEELPLFVVARTPTPINVDGVTDEEVWSRVRPCGPFVGTEHGQLGDSTTTAKLLYDNKYLYVAFNCQDKDVWSDLKERDENLWENEVVEIFINPTGSATKYLEFEVNPRNALWDGRITNPSGTGADLQPDSKWNCDGFKSAVKVNGTLDDRSDTDQGWSVEMAIPWTCLAPSPPQPGDVWRFNLYRIERDKDGKEQLLAWNPTRTTSFHVPAKFGRMLFSAKGPIYAPVF